MPLIFWDASGLIKRYFAEQGSATVNALFNWSIQVSALQAEVVSSLSFALFPIDPTDVFASTGMMRAHNLNATDAAILTVLVDYARSPGSPTCLLVAAD